MRIGRVTIGGGHPVAVQSMAKTDTRDPGATIAQIRELEEAGCEIIRVAVPDMAAARSLGAIKRGISIPLVADIHFNHQLALEAIRQGVDKLRINPGNLRSPEKVGKVVRAAAERGIPIRVGVNSGSLPPDIADSHPLSSPSGGAAALVASALRHLEMLEKLDFAQIVVSLKAFDVPTTILAYQQMARERDYPLHLGITEAGLAWQGTIRSAVGIGALLAQGLGDTLRVSLTAPPAEEVRVGKEILRSLGLREGGVVLISCPTCGRCELDLSGLAEQVAARLAPLDTRLWREGRSLRVAVMGCVVNGPGEARSAEVGVAGGKGGGVLFSQGQVLKTLPQAELLEELLAEVERVTGNG